MYFNSNTNKLTHFLDRDVYKKLQKTNNVYEAINLYIQYYQTAYILRKNDIYTYQKRLLNLEQLSNKNRYISEGKNIHLEKINDTEQYLLSHKDKIYTLIDYYMSALSQFSDKFNQKNCNKKLSNKQAFELLKQYYINCDKEGLNILNFMVENATILFCKDFEFAGLALWDPNIYNNFIIIDKDKKRFFTIHEIVVIVHEIEHVKWYINNCNNITEKERFKRTHFNGFKELNSITAEKSFIDYLIKNTDFKEEAKKYLIKLYKDMYQNAYHLNKNPNLYENYPILIDIYASYLSDLILENTNYDYDKTLNQSYNLMNLGSFANFDISTSKEKMTKVLKRQYEKIIE